MQKLILFILSGLCLSLSLRAEARNVDQVDFQRLKGFAQHKKENKDFDKDREKSKAEWQDEESLWYSDREKNLKKYLANRKTEKIYNEEKPEYKEWRAEKKQDLAEQEEIRLKYLAQRKENEKKLLSVNLSDEEEMDLLNTRPRYYWKKRTLYGGRGTFKGQAGSWGGSGRSSGSGGYTGGGSAGFPPPPSFDEGDNYIPPPMEFDEPPPPPPPPPSFGEEGSMPPPPPMGDFDSNGGF